MYRDDSEIGKGIRSSFGWVFDLDPCRRDVVSFSNAGLKSNSTLDELQVGKPFLIDPNDPLNTV